MCYGKIISGLVCMVESNIFVHNHPCTKSMNNFNDHTDAYRVTVKMKNWTNEIVLKCQEIFYDINLGYKMLVWC